MARMPSKATLARMVGICEGRYEALVADGCDEDVAADRTFDALRAALGEIPHSFDSRDRLFESKLRFVAAEGK